MTLSFQGDVLAPAPLSSTNCQPVKHVAVVYLEDIPMVKPFLLTEEPLAASVTPTQHSLSIMPEVCGMISPIGNLPGRRQRRCEAVVAAIQSRRRTGAAI
jgi:hypothetical protein